MLADTENVLRYGQLLMASAIAEGLTIISADEQFRQYVPQIQLVEA